MNKKEIIRFNNFDPYCSIFSQRNSFHLRICYWLGHKLSRFQQGNGRMSKPKLYNGLGCYKMQKAEKPKCVALRTRNILARTKKKCLLFYNYYMKRYFFGLLLASYRYYKKSFLEIFHIP